jgi:hypothetical protein
VSADSWRTSRISCGQLGDSGRGFSAIESGRMLKPSATCHEVRRGASRSRPTLTASAVGVNPHERSEQEPPTTEGVPMCSLAHELRNHRVVHSTVYHVRMETMFILSR